MLLCRAEHALGGQGEQGPRAEEVVEQLLGVEPGPHPVQGFGHLRDAPDLPGEFSQVKATFLVQFVARGAAVAAGGSHLAVAVAVRTVAMPVAVVPGPARRVGGGRAHRGCARGGLARHGRGGGVEIDQAGVVGAPGGDPVDAQGTEVVVGQPAHHELLQEAAPSIVGAGTAPSRGDDAGGIFGGEAQHGGTEGHLGVAPQGALAAAHGPAHHDRHAGLALEAGHAGAVAGLDLHAVDEPFDRGQGDPALAQGGQHMLDVAQEQGIRPDHQDPLALQREAVRIEKVCGPVQRHRRLAGAGTALDDHDAEERRANDLVLLPLDGGHDVAHGPGPGPFQRGQEGAGTTELELTVPAVVGSLVVPARAPVPVAGIGRRAGGVGGTVDGRRGAEALVLDPHDAPALSGQMAPQDQSHGVAPRGPVERLRHRRPPVDDQGLEVLARDPEPADVEALGFPGTGRRATILATVDPAEAQRLLPDVELVEAGEARPDDDVALLAELVRPAATLIDHGTDELLCVRSQLVEALIGPVHMGLFRLELRMRCHRRSPPPRCAVNHRSYRPGGAYRPAGNGPGVDEKGEGVVLEGKIPT